MQGDAGVFTALNLSSPSSPSHDQRTKISNCEAIFSNGSIWLLGRQRWEPGPVVGVHPGLPRGEARPGRAPRGPYSCSPRRRNSSCSALGRELAGRSAPGGSPGRALLRLRSAPQPSRLTHLHASAPVASEAWGAGSWDDCGTAAAPPPPTPRGQVDLHLGRARKLPKGKGAFEGVWATVPLPGATGRSCSSPATAVLNKNNRHKLSPLLFESLPTN